MGTISGPLHCSYRDRWSTNRHKATHGRLATFLPSCAFDPAYAHTVSPALLLFCSWNQLHPDKTADLTMGQQQPTADELLLARAEANGYQRGAYRELDEVRDREKYVIKTKKN